MIFSKFGSQKKLKIGTHKPWDQGPLSIDEGINVMQSACTGNSSTMGFVMLPQYHSSTSKAVDLKNRRLLEDKLVGCLDTFEVSMHYADSGHGGDRRKKSQQCFFHCCSGPLYFSIIFPGIENSKHSTGI